MPDINEVARYWDSRPCNIRHSPAPEGSLQWHYDVTDRKYLVEPHIPRFADFEAWKGKAVLDVGCGLGTMAISFARAGATVTALDVSRTSIAWASRRARMEGVEDSIEFVEADMEDFNIGPQAFDLIWAFGTIHHTPNPRAAIAQLRWYARPETVLRFMVYNRFSWKVLTIMLRERRFRDIDKVVAEWSEAQQGCPVTHTFTPAGIPALLDGYFTTTRITKEHIFPYRIEDYIQYRYVREWYWRVIPQWLFEKLEHIVGWHLCVEAKPV